MAHRSVSPSVGAIAGVGKKFGLPDLFRDIVIFIIFILKYVLSTYWFKYNIMLAITGGYD